MIARNLGGIPEFVRESGGGLLFTTDEELFEALERIRIDPMARAEMGERGYAAFTASWTERAHLDAYLTLVDQTAERKFGQLPWTAGA